MAPTAAVGSIARWSLIGLAGLIATGANPSWAEHPQASPITIDAALPYGQPPVDYHTRAEDNPIARLNKKLQAGRVELRYRKDHGYLLSLLKRLDISPSSQVLAFSKTARHPHAVGPKNPRAIYFNAQFYVAWVPGTSVVEVATIDPVKGAVFYVLPQHPDQRPRFRRKTNCLACHAGRETHRVPGFMVRSFLTDRRGKPRVGYSRITHQTPLSKRWGGWYVTGRSGEQTHLGNLIGKQDERRHERNPQFGGNVTDLRPYFDVSKYPTPHSDIVAQLVLNHQVYGQTLIIRAGQEHRFGKRSGVRERLLNYLLFADEASLEARIRGTSGFRDWFQGQAHGDAKGRTLRQFDLKTRLFEHRLSYLINTPAFEMLPEDLKDDLYRRLWEILNGQAPGPDDQPIGHQEGKALIEIVRAVKDDLPDCWHADSRRPEP